MKVRKISSETSARIRLDGLEQYLQAFDDIDGGDNWDAVDGVIGVVGKYQKEQETALEWVKEKQQKIDTLRKQLEELDVKPPADQAFRQSMMLARDNLLSDSKGSGKKAKIYTQMMLAIAMKQIAEKFERMPEEAVGERLMRMASSVTKPADEESS